MSQRQNCPCPFLTTEPKRLGWQPKVEFTGRVRGIVQLAGPLFTRAATTCVEFAVRFCLWNVCLGFARRNTLRSYWWSSGNVIARGCERLERTKLSSGFSLRKKTSSIPVVRGEGRVLQRRQIIDGTGLVRDDY
jgi:hypothetical protein